MIQITRRGVRHHRRDPELRAQLQFCALAELDHRRGEGEVLVATLQVIGPERFGVRHKEADRSDDEPIKQNHVAVEKILKALDVEVDWWPSA